MAKNCYAVKVIYNECASGQNWIEPFRLLESAQDELISYVRNSKYSYGLYREQANGDLELVDGTELGLYDQDGKCVWSRNDWKRGIDMGDYTITIEAI